MATRRWFLAIAGGAATAALTGTARASGGLKAELAVDRERLRVGEELRVGLIVTRTGSGSVPDAVLPEALTNAFEIVSQFSSSSSTGVLGLGGVSGSLSLTTTLGAIALVPGKHKLSFTVSDGDAEVKSNTVTVVVEGDAPAATVTASGAKPTESLGDVFLWVATDKSKAYVGEQINYSLDVYTRRRFLSVTLSTPPSFADFHTYDLAEGEPRTEMIDGVVHRVRSGMRRALFPQKAGMLKIAPAEIEIGRRRRDASPTLVIEVLPLPAEGQPPGFAATNVGQFQLAASVDKTRVDVGRPFTYTVTLTGTGNLPLVDPGRWPELKGARRYDPKVETEMPPGDRIGGTRTFTFLVIPEAPGTLVLPKHVMHYFDPERGRYTKAETAAIEVQVEGTAVQPQGEPATERDEERERFAAVIPGDTVPRDTVRDRWLTPQRWLWGMLAVPTIVGSVWAASTAWAKLGPDETRRRQASERQRRRERIDTARRAIESGEGFHAELATLLHDHAIAMTDGDGVGLARPELLRMLARGGVAADDVRRLESLLDKCDAARFAAQRGSVAERQSLFDEALAILRDSTLARRRP